MRKLSKRLRDRLPSVKLYADDLQRLKEILSEAGDAVTVKTSDYEFDTLEELKNIGKFVREIDLETDKTRVWVWIKKDGVSLSSASDVTSRGLLAEVKAFLLSRRRWGTRVFSSPFSVALGATLMTGSGNAATLDSAEKVVLPILLVAALGAFLVVMGFGDFPRTIIFTTRRSERPSVWERNKDQLLLQVVSGVISLVVGLVVGYLLGKDA